MVAHMARPNSNYNGSCFFAMLLPPPLLLSLLSLQLMLLLAVAKPYTFSTNKFPSRRRSTFFDPKRRNFFPIPPFSPTTGMPLPPRLTGFHRAPSKPTPNRPFQVVVGKKIPALLHIATYKLEWWAANGTKSSTRQRTDRLKKKKKTSSTTFKIEERAHLPGHIRDTKWRR